jgi:3-ketosteroid 9alpha-monooxygenase subunit A
MRVPFTWKPTGWFMIAWSADIPVGQSIPLKYFGQHLVAYRGEDGVAHVLDAHCLHLGAHLGHGGKVKGDCIECPYHGWGWGPDGINKYIPYEDRPNVSKQLTAWTVLEQNECVFMWHDPHGGPPTWQLPNVFDAIPHLAGRPDDYYRAHPELSVTYRNEPVHPQVTLENGPDSVHFKYVHRATVDPVLLHWDVQNEQYRTTTGWPTTKAASPGAEAQDGMALKIHTINVGVGGSVAVFEGSARYRLIFFTTPVDDETSDLFYAIWWPRDGDSSDVAPESTRELVRKRYIQTLWDDLEIWRYQVYVEHPIFAQQDAKPYGALRKWARQFYNVEPVSPPNT